MQHAVLQNAFRQAYPMTQLSSDCATAHLDTPISRLGVPLRPVLRIAILPSRRLPRRGGSDRSVRWVAFLPRRGLHRRCERSRVVRQWRLKRLTPRLRSRSLS